MNLTRLFQSFLDFCGSLFDVIIDKLPLSPFAYVEYMSLSKTYMGWLNYLLPISQIVAVLQLWIVAVASYYVYKAVLAWLKVSG